jgi:hypothetical protein
MTTFLIHTLGLPSARLAAHGLTRVADLMEAVREVFAEADQMAREARTRVAGS